MPAIKFGTDGWRGILGQDFTFDNTDKVINAAAIYIYKDSGYGKKILIAYDPRNKADEFALYIAKKFAALGFDTEISSEITATPVLAYSAVIKKAFAFMITASHNPPEYLGIKFIPPYGGPAEDYMVKEIEDKLEDKFFPKRDKQELKYVHFDEEYIEHLEKIIDINAIRNSKIEINYDGHHGAAAHTFKKIMDKNKIKCKFQNMERDINFGGSMPDPKEIYLKELKKLCIKTGNIGLSNDGDGDRFGVFDEKGCFVNANYIIAMLLKHLVKNKKYTGKLAKTVGASSMLDLYAEKNGIEVIETPVGFKHLGKAMRDFDVIIAGEESGGLSIKGHIPEKDGILACLLIMEMLAYSNSTLCKLNDDFLKEIQRKFFTKRIDIKLASTEKQDEIINKLKLFKQIGKYKILKTNTMDGLKIYLEDNSIILIRKSGTEPLLRIYFETDKEEKSTELEKEIKLLY